MSLEKKLEADLQALQQLQVLRSLPSPSDYKLVDFTSNDFLSLTSYEPLRRHFLQKLAVSRDVLGSGGSRLLVNGTAHNALEERLKAFFCAPAALLFNSGFDANVGFFSCIPHEGDVVVYDEYIHASVRDGIQASRARGKASKAFSHNSMRSLREVLERFIEQRPALRTGEANVIVAVESLYSMDGTFAPLVEIVGLVESLFPAGNGHVIVDEAHTTGLYGQDGRGLVSSLGLEGRVLARLHTFGKALGSSGAVMLVTPVIKAYLLNHARTLIFTTSLSAANIVAINCSFDMLENGTSTQLAGGLKELIRYTMDLLREGLRPFPSDLVSLPENLSLTSISTERGRQCLLSPIIPILTPAPFPLSAFLRERGLNAQPITLPAVPRGKERVRVCLHVDNTREQVEHLVNGTVAWAKAEMESRNTKRFAVAFEAKL